MNKHIPKVKAHTVNLTVYRWSCTYCGTKNTTLETELVSNKENPETRFVICIKCVMATEIEHHTFLKPKRGTN